MNAKVSVFVVCFERILYLLLYNLHDFTFKQISLSFEVNSNGFILADFNQTSKVNQINRQKIFLIYETSSSIVIIPISFPKSMMKIQQTPPVLLLPSQASTKNLISIGIHFENLAVFFKIISFLLMNLSSRFY